MKQLWIGVMLIAAAVSAWALQSPAEFLGFRPGEKGRLAHYDQIRRYFERAAAESPLVRVRVMGRTTRGRELFAAVVSAAANLERLDEYRAVTRKLSLAEVGESEARGLAQSGRAVVFVTCNQHSDEIASSQMSMELLHRLLSDDGPGTRAILDNLILVLVPSVNPDGQALVTEWNEKYRGTAFEGTSVPYLYHWYAGHDNNRDWFRLSLAESRVLTRELYSFWYPQLILEEHQMDSDGDRFYLPPLQDPPTPDVHPLLWRTVSWMGARTAMELEKDGFRGVASRGIFTAWWIGSLDDTACLHNVTGILFEAASANLATPIYIEPEEVRSGESRLNEPRMFSPNPWPGGWWSLRDIMDYDLAGTLSVLRTVAGHRTEFLLNIFRMAGDSIRRGSEEAPYAYVVPPQQHDMPTAMRFIRILLQNGVRVERLNREARVGDTVFAAGSFLVPLAQAYRPFVKNLFELQRYPDLRRKAGDTTENPYDMAGWTLPLGMGVKYRAVTAKTAFDSRLVSEEDLLPPLPDLQEYIVLDPRSNTSFLAAAVLLGKGVPVHRSRGVECPAAFVVRKSAALPVLQALAAEVPLQLDSRPDAGAMDLRPLKNPRIGLYGNWGHNTSEGWLRCALDEYRIPYTTLRPDDLARPDFIARYDVLVFTGVGESEIDSGVPARKRDRWPTPRPPEFSGGIGNKGKKNLEAFLAAGKSLVFMGASCEYAIGKLNIPIENVMAGENRVACPGSYLRMEVKAGDLTAGMEPDGVVFYRGGPVFEVVTPRTAREERYTPLVFPRRDLLVSGSLQGEEFLARRALVVDYRNAAGRVVLIGPDLIHRTHSESTYKIVFNALFAAAER